MKNTYLAIGVILLIVIAGFMFKSNKTEAPLKNEEVTKENSLAGRVALSDGDYTLDVASSKILWEGEKITGSKEKGLVLLESGNLKIENGIPVSGEFTIDMNTIKSDPEIEMLIKHLKSDDFFSVDKYPTAKFVLKTVTPSSEAGAKEGRYILGGDLTVKGITKPISFTANIKSDGDSLSATASFALNRTEWDIKYGSSSFFGNLGDKAIKDAIMLGLDLKAQKVIE